jgi:ribonuclease BN (tRNA processing enzyme)
MEVKLTVIGSSPAWPNPGSAHAGYLLEGSGRLLLDCGPGVLSRLRQTELFPVDAIAITHFHLDHWGDLVPWVWLSVSGLAPAERSTLFVPPRGRERLADFGSQLGYSEMFESTFAISEYEPLVPFVAAGFEVVAHPVAHFDLQAFGFRVRGRDGRLLAYSGDSAPCEELRTIAAGADAFLCEATLASGREDSVPRGHLSAEEAIEHATGRLLLTHRPAELETPPDASRVFDGTTTEI